MHDPERGIYERCSGCRMEIGGDEFPVESRNGDFCRECAGKEINRLEELLRWRKWPREKPGKSGRYLKLLPDRCEELTRFNLDEFCHITQKWWGSEPAYWRPSGSLPSTEVGDE